MLSVAQVLLQQQSYPHLVIWLCSHVLHNEMQNRGEKGLDLTVYKKKKTVDDKVIKQGQTWVLMLTAAKTHSITGLC